MRRLALGLLVLSIMIAPATTRAASTCDAGYAQHLIRQGLSYLDAQHWKPAYGVAQQLEAYAPNCDADAAVKNPIVVYDFYIYAVSLHETGDDPHAEEAVAAGMRILEQLKQQGGYADLYDSVRPLFVDIQGRIAGGYR